VTKKANLLHTKLLLDHGFSTKLIDSLPGIFYLYQVTEDNFKLIGWNRKHETALGYSADELENMSIKEFFNSKDFARIQKGLKKVFETGEWRLKADIIMKNGKSIPPISLRLINLNMISRSCAKRCI